jgi:hypothetical protein
MIVTMPGDDPNTFDDLDADEAAELAAHLKKMRAKKDLKAKLQAAEEATAKLKAELAGLEITDDTRASAVGAPLPEREAMARRQAAPAPGDPMFDLQSKGLQGELARMRAIEGILPPEHGRTAITNPEGQHLAGGLSAESRLPKGYNNHVRVIEHRFKHRARNGRTMVDDASLQRLKEQHPEWEWDG